MKKLEQIDKNFQVDTQITAEDICWYDPDDLPFQIHGLLHDAKGYLRMDENAAKNVSEGVFSLNRHTSGGRLTFETDSPYIAISVDCDKQQPVTMPLTGYMGFDLYLDREDGQEFTNVFLPPVENDKKYEGIFCFREEGTHKVLLHFPLYNPVRKLYIGLKRAAAVLAYSPYSSEPPVVFYGSSITQGGCVSRPGNSYPAIVSRLSGKNYVCFGFSGSAHGEQEMARYIASLPMSAFVLDYDHNDCDNLPRLESCHEAFYKTVRAAHPDIPIIIMSAPYAARTFYESHPARSKKILLRTYRNAKAEGDNVYFIDGEKIFGKDKDAALTDRIHPNDFGHLQMARRVLRCMRQIEKEQTE